MSSDDKIPPRYWYEFMDRFTRRDELLVTLIKDMRKLLEKGIKVTVPTDIIIESITIPLQQEFIDQLARRLMQLPNRFDKIEIDTSKESWLSMRKAGNLKGDVLLGFQIQDVGGGFTYKVQREPWVSKERTAYADDKWNLEFDDLAVVGSGDDGTAIVWYWWRE